MRYQTRLLVTDVIVIVAVLAAGVAAGLLLFW